MLNPKKIITSLLFVLLLCFSFKIKAQWVTIPDANFVSYLQQYYPTCMNGNLMDTTCSWITSAAYVDCANRQIQSLDGIQYFDSLISLSCGINLLTALPTLPANINYIYCSSNSLTSLPALPSGIDTLYCYDNYIANLPALPASLTYFNCSYNLLTSLPTLPASLSLFDCSNNQLTTLPTLSASLSLFDCSDNQLTTLPLLPANLSYFDCSQNLLTSVPVLPSTIVSFSCHHNNLTSLPSLPTSLQDFWCGYNQLTYLPVLPSALNWLFCENNQLTSVPNFPSTLTDIRCYNNQLISLPPLPPSLKILNCSGNLLTSIDSLPPLLLSLYCANNQLTSLPVLNASLKTINCSENQLTILPILPPSLTHLVCHHNQLTSLPEFPDGLDQFICSFNQISCLPYLPSSLNYLSSWEISSNPITCLPNYISGMDSTIAAMPLCADNDWVNNPNGCAGFKGAYGYCYNDANSNCINDGGDVMTKNISINQFNSTGTLQHTFYSLANGIYNFILDTGSYVVAIDTTNKPFTVNCQHPGIDSAFTLTAQNPLAENINFDIACKPGFDVGVKSINVMGLVFPGLSHKLSVNAGDLSKWYNLNCISGVSGNIVVNVSGPVLYDSIPFNGLAPTSIVNNVFTYNIADFASLNFNSIAVWFKTSTLAQAGSQVCVSVLVNPISGDNDATNNNYTFCYLVTNSYDPNDKQVYPDTVAPLYNGWFTYAIRFQNTGTAPAQNIRIVDTLNSNLDLSTFEIINYSHANTSTLTGNIATFRFPNIQLPDSATNPEGSKGFIQYRVKPIANLPLGTQIENTAHIYFDFNVPVITNTVTSTYSNTVGVNSLTSEKDFGVRLYPNPGNGIYHLLFESENRTEKKIEVFNVFGKSVFNTQTKNSSNVIDLSGFADGVYFLNVIDAGFNRVLKLVKQ